MKICVKTKQCVILLKSKEDTIVDFGVNCFYESKTFFADQICHLNFCFLILDLK